MGMIHPNRVFGLGVTAAYDYEFGWCHRHLSANVTPEIKSGESLTPPPSLTKKRNQNDVSSGFFLAVVEFVWMRFFLFVGCLKFESAVPRPVDAPSLFNTSPPTRAPAASPFAYRTGVLC